MYVSILQFAQWESGKGFSLVPQRIDRQKEVSLNKERTYIISTLLDEPFLYEQDQDEAVIDHKLGIVDEPAKYQGKHLATNYSH